jgi:uncharacterized membrane protein YgdD (TMEM256/DUF423 family)
MVARLSPLLIVLAAMMGAAGIVLAAASVHQTDASRLGPASSMLLFHASAVLATVALIERGVVNDRLSLAAAWGFVIAATLFATDLTLRQYFGHSLFPFAAPIGGTLLILSWLLLALAGAWPRRNS